MGDYCGGTFQGLQAKLDYIRGMGFDAIWNHLDHPSGGQYAEPTLKRGEKKTTDISTDTAGGYHGHWAQDLYSINAKYGSADDLKNLVNTAHERQMYVMVDVVANHMGPSALPSSTKARHITPPAKSTTRTRRPSRTAKYMYGFIAKVLDVKKSAGGLAGDDHAHLFVDSTAYA
ncbi:alpha-amylase 1 [Metarhizium acridum CQMa 102]|uniref:Alpha-amylase 1 n=1 Tax=Metarhizium acridum (strain CQMa 102) TaxID=655827 RepID=E9E7K2_METAQ|nr:alpha-amylase 1 [Metarhizium acridum CQMa 102]EFY88112.1 alpha-amylase 1 [Metarhizium acridum CQMa 102]